MSRERFEELLQLLLDDELTRQQVDELTQLIAQDACLAIELRQHLQMSDHLSQYEDQVRCKERFTEALEIRIKAANDSDRFVEQVVSAIHGGTSRGQASGPQTSETSSSESLRHASMEQSWVSQRTLRGIAGWVAAAFVLMLLGGVLILPREPTTSPLVEIDAPVVESSFEEVDDMGVAVLTRVAHPIGEQLIGLVEGETIPPGKLQWDSGMLQFEFYSGATVVVEGPADIEFLDETRVQCRYGRLRAHVPEPARGFTVLAPNFELVDRGTEFGLEISAEGNAEVHVFDGTVELYDAKSDRDQSTRRELNTGDAVTMDRDGTSKLIAARDSDFVSPNRLNQMEDVRGQGQLRDWRHFRDAVKTDPRVVAYFPFDWTESADRLLMGHGADGSILKGAIVGCEWSEGRWPGKHSLQFKRPGDRVRINVPGEHESLTYSTWLRLDGLDRKYNSLLLTDDFNTKGIHWQIRQDGVFVFSVKKAKKHAEAYKTEPIFNLFRLGQWMHLATVYDSGKLQVTHYVNGKLAIREKMHRRRRQNTAGKLKIGEATIGNWSFPNDAIPHDESQKARRVRNLNGCIDELIVYGEALDDEEILHIYEVGRP